MAYFNINNFPIYFCCNQYLFFIYFTKCIIYVLQKAESDLAYNLQAAKTRQRIKEEQMQVKVIERTQDIQVQEQEIMRKERELEATVRRPAEAEKYKLEKLAEANRYL